MHEKLVRNRTVCVRLFIKHSALELFGKYHAKKNWC